MYYSGKKSYLIPPLLLKTNLTEKALYFPEWYEDTRFCFCVTSRVFDGGGGEISGI